MSEWPKGVVIEWTGDRYVVLDGTPPTDLTDCAEYVPASELERVTGERDMERAAHGRASDLAGYLEDRRAEAEAKLVEVRAEVEKAEANAQLGNGGELEDPLANIKAILDSSPPLSGGGESSGVVDLSGGPVLVDLPSGELATVLGYVVSHDDGELEVMVREEEGFDRDDLLAALGEADTDPDRTAELEKALRDVRFHTGRGETTDGTILEIRETVDRALSSTQPAPGTTNTSLSGDVEERGEEGFPWREQSGEVTKLGLPDAHNLPEWLEVYANRIEEGAEVPEVERKLMAITLRAAQRVVEGTPPFSTQQSSTTGNSLSGEPGDRETAPHIHEGARDTL